MDKEAGPGIARSMTSPPRPRTLFLVDDHPVVGAGFELAALKSPEFAWLGSAPSLSAAAARLDALSPDVLVLDLVIDQEIGVASIAECRAAWPRMQVVVFSSMPAAHYAHACLAEGALAYCEKSDPPVRVLSRVAEALSGAAAPRPVAARAGGRPDAALLQSLDMTPREVELLSHLAQGRSAGEIAAHLGKSAKTVAAQRDTIRRKLGCRSTREMTALLSRLLAPPS
jgi:DNA-binding NarL/FixJ family response regulator